MRIADYQTLRNLEGSGALAAAVLSERGAGWREAGRRLATNSQHRRNRSPVGARTPNAPAPVAGALS